MFLCICKYTPVADLAISCSSESSFVITDNDSEQVFASVFKIEQNYVC